MSVETSLEREGCREDLEENWKAGWDLEDSCAQEGGRKRGGRAGVVGGVRNQSPSLLETKVERPTSRRISEPGGIDAHSGEARAHLPWGTLNTGEILVSSGLLCSLLCVRMEERVRGGTTTASPFCAPDSQMSSQLIPKGCQQHR